jgi:hypothetical protein
MDAISAAIGKQGVKLPTQTMTSRAQSAVDVAATMSEQLQATTQKAVVQMGALQAEADNIYVRQQQELVRTGAAVGDKAVQEQLVTQRNLDVRNQAFADKSSILAENAREVTSASKQLETQIDAINNLNAEEGIVGFLKRSFFKAGMVDDANETISQINARNRMQTALVEQSASLADAQVSLMPTKTPEQLEAEAKIARSNTEQLVQKSQLVAIDDAEKHFNEVMAAQQIAATAAGATAGRETAISHAQFAARVDAIKSAADGAAKIAAFTQARDALGGEVNVNRRVEQAFNWTPGEGKQAMDRIQRFNPDAAAAMVEYAYSNTTSDPAALAQGMNFMVPGQVTPSLKALAGKVLDAETNLGTFLATKSGMTLDMFKKLPSSQQAAIRKEFNADRLGKVPSALVDSTAASIMQAIKTSVPTGVIEIPAIVGADGVVTKEAKKIKLLPMGEIGKQVEALQGDGTAVFELAKQAVVVDKRDVKVVAREMANFFQNALTVENSYRGNERRMFGLGMTEEFMQTIKEQGYLYGEANKNINLASYPEVLAALTRAKIQAMPASMSDPMSGKLGGTK